MIKLISCLLLVLVAVPSWGLDRDKELHLGVSALISGVSYGMFRQVEGMNQHDAYMSAVGVTLAVGLLKELTDEKVDRGDLVADAAGALVGPMMFVVWEF